MMLCWYSFKIADGFQIYTTFSEIETNQFVRGGEPKYGENQFIEDVLDEIRRNYSCIVCVEWHGNTREHVI